MVRGLWDILRVCAASGVRSAPEREAWSHGPSVETMTDESPARRGSARVVAAFRSASVDVGHVRTA